MERKVGSGLKFQIDYFEMVSRPPVSVSAHRCGVDRNKQYGQHPLSHCCLRTCVQSG